MGTAKQRSLGARVLLWGFGCGVALGFGAPAQALLAQRASPSTAARVVTYGLGDAPPRRWRIDAKPLREIGGAAAEGPSEFGEIRGVTRLSDGRIVVANGATNEIRIFLATGAFEHALGRTGGGPGEFTKLRRLLRTGDTLVGADGDSRAQVFGPDGHLIQTLPPIRSAAIRSLQRIGVMADLNTFVTGIEGSGRLSGDDSVEVMVVLRGTATSDSLSPLVRLGGAHIKRIGSTQGRVLLDAEGTAVARRERVCAGYSSAFDVTCYDATGKMVFRIVRATQLRRVSEADRALVRAAFLDANRDAPPAIRKQMESAANEFMFADRIPAFSRLILAATGELWVSQFDPAVNLPGRSALLAPNEPRRWDVFSPDGRWLADVELPARFVPYDMERDVVIGVTFDADDVERVTMWRLVR